jgi:hypothetical protein
MTAVAYSPRWLIEFTVSSTTYYFSNDDIYVSNQLYKGDLINWDSIAISESFSDRTWGSYSKSTQSFVFDDIDGFWRTLIASNNLRGVAWTVKRHDTVSGTTTTLAVGRITGYTLSTEAEIDVEFFHEDVLDTVLPAKLTNTTDWPSCYSEDLGKPVQLVFGYAKSVPLYYVYNNGTNVFDYLIGYGPIESIDAVYRNNVLVNPSEYSLVQSGDYSYVRFVLEQMDFSGQFYTLTADIRGLKLGGASAQRGFARVIQNILSNTTWGLSETVNTTSFDSANTVLNTLAAVSPTGFYCDGFLAEQKEARIVIEELAKICRGYLRRNSSGEWELIIDEYDSTTAGSLGWGDGYWDNILTDVPERSTTSLSDAIKSIKFRYGVRRTTDNKDLPYYENTRSVFSYGKDLIEESAFVNDHPTADKYTCYIKQLALYSDDFLTVKTDIDSDFSVTDIVTLYIPAYDISGSLYKIIGKKTYLHYIEYDLAEYSSSIYTYTLGTLPSDENGPSQDELTPGGITTYRQDAQPAGDLNIGDLWYDTNDYFKRIYRYTGVDWEEFSTYGAVTGGAYGNLYDDDGSTHLSGDDIVTNRFATAASPNPRIVISGTQIAGYSDATTKEFYIQASNGKAYFGGGTGIIDSNGLSIVGKGQLRYIGGLGNPRASTYYDSGLFTYAYDSSAPTITFGRWTDAFGGSTTENYLVLSSTNATFIGNVSAVKGTFSDDLVLSTDGRALRLSGDSGSISILGGRYATTGAHIKCNGRDYSTHPGRLVLQCGGYNATGDIIFRFRSATADNDIGSIDYSGNLTMSGDVEGATLTATSSGTITGGKVSCTSVSSSGTISGTTVSGSSISSSGGVSGTIISASTRFDVGSVARLNSSAILLIGDASAAPGGTNNIVIKVGTAPSSVSQSVVLYAKAYGSDYGLAVRTEDGNIINLYKMNALTAQEVAYSSITFPNHSNDYAFSVGTTGFGNANELWSMCSVLKNAVLRIAQLEARLQSAGMIP